MLQQPEQTPELQHNHTQEKSRDKTWCSHFLPLFPRSDCSLSLTLPATSRLPSDGVKHKIAYPYVLAGSVQVSPVISRLRWMSRDTEGYGWCMIVCERGDRGPGPEIARFNPSLWTWPLSQLQSSCSNTRQVSSLLLPTHCLSQGWFLVVRGVQADKIASHFS